MNPPSAIHGSMSRERKPFTYTPGGLDLSEIKSERMAKRLMRNAMNQGVPELPQPIQSPTTATPIAVPNYNCLPVQVFPAFQLPANPKSLLRTRSTPEQPREPLRPRVPPQSQDVNNFKSSGIGNLRETINNNAQVNNNNSSNNRPTSLYECSVANNANDLTRNNYGSDSSTEPTLPQMSYDAQYFEAAPRISNKDSTLYAPQSIENGRKSHLKEIIDITVPDFTIKPLSDTNFVQEPVVISKPVEDNVETDDDDDEQKEVKVVKKVVKKKVESHNGEQNGDANSDAVTTVKLAPKKSAAKTETKVEVVKKTLPDGSVEEIKTTITKTTIDGKTEITTKTETQIIPKEEEDEEEVIEVEEEEEEEGEVIVQETEENGKEEVEEEPVKVVIKKSVQETPVSKESSKIVKKEESSATTTTTKKVVVVQQSNKEEQEVEGEEEEEEEEEEVEVLEPVVIKKPAPSKEVEQKEVVEIKKQEIIEKVEVQNEVKDEEVEEKIKVVEVEKKEIRQEIPKKEEPEEEEEEVEEEEEFEEAEETVTVEKPKETVDKKPESTIESKEQKDEESEYTEEEIESEKEESLKEVPVQQSTPQPEPEKNTPKEEVKPVTLAAEPVAEPKAPLREPSIPLEKVEDVEIKPIGAVNETVSKTHTESTEILSNANLKPAGSLSTQTEYNRIENIVTVNRTTKTLDHSYEQLTQQGIPTVKTYFAPDRERVGTSPQPSKPYQPVYPAQPQTERRHSLLLERLSTERQLPTTDIYQNNYQYNNQSFDQQRQWSQEPQSEVINVSNVKPSTITNQQWYQQTRKDNVIYNNVAPSTPAAPTQQWSQPQQQSQPQFQPQTQSQPQIPSQSTYQAQYQPQIQSQYQPQIQSQYQKSFTENTVQDSSRISTSSNTYQQSNYSSYAPKPSNWATPNLASTIPAINTPSNQYSYLNKDSSESYQSTQQYSSSYVPPPWEQDPSYIAPEIPTQNVYQAPPPSTNTFSPSSNSGWKPTPPAAKFSKPAPKAYVPPAPNQSFVKNVHVSAEPPKQQGRKTYYSEYERRYITVPESTYIPSETKLQPQPDPSPQYYYDNNEPNESVEHEWRKELREFTEKTSQTQEQTEITSVKPPWEEETKYAKVPTVSYTPTPSWSQTLRPQSWRERSFESEYVGSQEWSKTNTLGRGRPLSSYGNSNIEATIPERPARGVSVDRYNPNNYQPPITSEHGPVQTHTLNPTASPHMKGYHNPNVPAYHARASAEPREQPIPNQQSRQYRESRASPIQSRSFKYLQWMTGTEN